MPDSSHRDAIRSPIAWPMGKKFAFTVFDDTDHATLENNRAIYGLLRDLGMRSTKSVWAFDSQLKSKLRAVTCEDTEYVSFLRELQREGFEIGWHNATWGTSLRADTERGLDLFREIFGLDPVTMSNHASNSEGIYWGTARLGGWREGVYRRMQPMTFEGHMEGSPLFWGDLCSQRIRYVRNFTFPDLNTLNECPFMPYYDPQRPFVNAWYASSDAGDDVTLWNRAVTEAAIDKLEAEGGACIAYTHFGKWFYEHGALDRRFREVMTYLAKKDAWFPTVAELLDFLAQQRGGQVHQITDGERAAMETRWLMQSLKLRVGHRGRELARRLRERILGR